jgi:Domain of unknown function (DUF1937)
MKNLESLEELKRRHGYWYVASPYSKYSGGMVAAHSEAVHFTADLLRVGVPAFSPIAHSHYIGLWGALPHTWDFWKEADWPMLHAADGLIVLMMDGWRESVGVSEELASFRKRLQPEIRFVDPETYRVFAEAPEMRVYAEPA